jgi:hypothetical protein
MFTPSPATPAPGSSCAFRPDAARARVCPGLAVPVAVSTRTLRPAREHRVRSARRRDRGRSTGRSRALALPRSVARQLTPCCRSGRRFVRDRRARCLVPSRSRLPTRGEAMPNSVRRRVARAKRARQGPGLPGGTSAPRGLLTGTSARGARAPRAPLRIWRHSLTACRDLVAAATGAHGCFQRSCLETTWLAASPPHRPKWRAPESTVGTPRFSVAGAES